MEYLNYRKVGDQLILVFLGREPITVEKSHRNYDRVLEYINEIQDYSVVTDNGFELVDAEVENLLELVSTKKAIQKWVGNGPIKIEDNEIIYRGEVQSGYIVDVILRMLDEDEEVDPLVNFLENLLQNPLSGVRDQLYGFLEYGKNAITPDGHFLAYKYVDNDLRSCHWGVYDLAGNYDASGRYDHTIGNIVEMPRERCDNDPNNTCSKGLHVCSREYLGNTPTSGGNRIVVCKVNPRDVVAVPTDYNNTKMRTCRYEVVAELKSEDVDNDVLAEKPVNNDFENDQDFYIEEEEINSSFIDAIEYWNGSKFLYVYFNTGQTYRYSDVFGGIANQFRCCEDHSEFFHKHIKDNYDYEIV